jgi:hypothetical protein
MASITPAMRIQVQSVLFKVFMQRMYPTLGEDGIKLIRDIMEEMDVANTIPDENVCLCCAMMVAGVLDEVNNIKEGKSVPIYLEQVKDIVDSVRARICESYV